MGIVLIVGSRVLINLYPVEPIPKYVEPKTVNKVVTIPVEPKPKNVAPKRVDKVVTQPVAVKPKVKKVTARVKPISKPKKIFKCDGRKHCSQMRSYDEAKYFNDYCPDTKMDGDRDGIPCERQFRR